MKAATIIGCCGFPVGRDKYFDEFSCVELQQTFYQPPGIDTVKKWRQQAPEDFEFTLKAWQLITHTPESPTYRRLKFKIPQTKKKNYGGFKPIKEVFSAWDVIDEIAQELRSKVVVFQCPAKFTPTKQNIENMKIFFQTIKRRDYLFVWEPRGDWDKDLVGDLCRRLRLIHCVDPFKNPPIAQGINYFRLHGIGGYNYQYSPKDLKFLKGQLDSRPAHLNYVMFNNVYMLKDALRFKQLI